MSNPHLENMDFYMSHTMKDNDTFNFKCKMCGGCCTGRNDEPIVINGVDIYRMAKGKNISCENVLTKYTRYHIGDSSGLPVLTLRTDEDGKCLLMKNNKCSVQEYKPSVCAVYPLGRMTIASRDVNSGVLPTFQYFQQPAPCHGVCTKETYTLKEWRERGHLIETEHPTILWNALIGHAMQITRQVSLEKDEMLRSHIMYMLYVFDTNVDLTIQIQDRAEKLKNLIQDAK